MSKPFLFLIGFIFVISCSGGKYQENQKRINELYGECDNPSKLLTKKQRKQCMVKQRAEGDSFFDFEGDLNNLIGRNNQNIIYQSPVNPYLWRASLEITSSYPLKIADNQGGYLETDWIIDKNNQNQRCIIKINILAAELLSTAVSTNLICENKLNGSWTPDNVDYTDEEKQLTLKILKIGSDLANTSTQ